MARLAPRAPASPTASRKPLRSCPCGRRANDVTHSIQQLESLAEPGEAYGYEIVSKLTAETNGALEVTDGTLYPVLYRLERGGFVAVRWETPERGVPRKYYRLTDAGRDELVRLTREWTTFAKAMSRLLRQEREAR